MVNVIRCFLGVLRQQTVLADVASPLSDFASQAARNAATHASLIPRNALRVKLHEGQHFRQLRQGLGLVALGPRELALMILPIKQPLQSSVERMRQPELAPVAGEVKLK